MQLTMVSGHCKVFESSLSLLSILELKVTTIYPATQNHIDKNTIQTFFLVEETPEMYETIILPILQKQQFSLEWVYNILDHGKEVDRIIFEDPDPVHGFMLMKDMKWSDKVESLHVTAIVLDRTIKSLRDLNASHLPMLESIKKNSLEAINTKFGLNPAQVRAYFHYQPSYYHLHVHFTNLKFDAPGIICGRAHLLNSVISNIKLMSDYYQMATLTFATGEKHYLYKAIKAAGETEQQVPESS